MDDKTLTQHETWNYKYIGSVPVENLEYILIDVEANSPCYLTEDFLQKLRKICADSKQIRVYYSEQSGEFILEPAKNFLEE